MPPRLTVAQVRRVAKRLGVRPDLLLLRYAHVLDRERGWTTKLRLAQTKLKKLRAQRRYYEKRLGVKEAA